MKNLYTGKTDNGSDFGWLIRQMSINQKSGRQTFRRRFVSGSVFVSPCPPECYYKSKPKLSLISGYRSIGMAPHQVTEKTVPGVWSKLYGQRLDQKTTPQPLPLPPAQMSSGRSRTTRQETSALQKRLFTGMDRRSACGHAHTSSSSSHLWTH